MPAIEAQKEELKLNRKLQNHAFQSWRLKHGSLRSRSDIDLPFPIAAVKSDAVDYVHTRARVLHNHLLQSQGRLFCFLNHHAPQQGQLPGTLKVVEACCVTAGAEASCTLRLLGELSSAAASETQANVEAKVDPSLAVINTSALPSPTPAQPPSSSSAAAAAKASEPLPHYSPLHGALLISSGGGELSLLYPDPAVAAGKVPAAPMLWSSPASPLRPLPPLVGQRPVCIEAAYAIASDALRVIAWAVKSAGPRAPDSGSHRGQPPHTTCETYVITLKLRSPASAPASASATAAPGPSDPSPIPPGPGSPPTGAPASVTEQQLQLEVTDVRLLRVSSLPPHLVMVNPVQDAVVLGLDPEGADAGEEPQGTDVMHIDCTKGAAAPATSAMDQDDDIDPRTLAEAAARLAKYTSEEPTDEPPQQQWTDLYKESGPDGVGAMGGEPCLDLVLLSAAAPGVGPAAAAAGAGGAAGSASASAASTAAASGSDGGGDTASVGGGAGVSAAGHQQAPGAGGSGAAAAPRLPAAEWRLSCGANRVLSCESASQGLIGLSDDVDCAVVSVAWPPELRQPKVVHEVYVPALAYVVAGKVHKKHLLLGQPNGPVAAVLIEGQRLYYVYRRTANRQESGLQDIVEMQLQDGESVLGARLVDLAAAAGGGGSVGSVGAGAAEAGAGCAGLALLLLTQHRLLVHQLTAD